MNIIFSTPIDAMKEVDIIGRLPLGGKVDAWTELLIDISDLYDRFIQFGGVECTPEDIKNLSGLKTFGCKQDEFNFRWARFPGDGSALSIFLRMLSNLRNNSEALESLSINGSPVAPTHPSALAPCGNDRSVSPVLIQPLPFELEALPFNSWFNIECNIQPPIPDQIPGSLNERIWCWRDVAVAGGFGPVSALLDEDGDLPDMGIDGPVVGDDFIEWHCLMSGVPHQSLNSLINILAVYSKTIIPFTSVYVG